MTDTSTDDEQTRDVLRQAIAFHQEGRLVEADSEYSRVLEAEPTNPQALRLRGILARQRGDILGSLEDLKAAVETTPDDADALCELALSYMEAGELTPAVAALRDAVDADSSSHKARANLGALLQYRGHVSEAIEVHKQALAIEPDDLEVRSNLAKALADAGRFDEAIAETDETLSRSGQHPMALANKGSVLCDAERFEEAASVLERAVAGDPSNEVAQINLGVACLSLGRKEDAATALQRAVKNNPHNARGVADLANVLSSSGRGSEALSLCETFLAQHPGERMVVASYAYALRDAGRAEDAQALFDFDRYIRVTDLDAPKDYDSIADLNGALATIIKDHSSLIANPLSKATHGGSQTGELDLDDDAALTAFETMIGEAIVEAAAAFRAGGAARHTLLTDPPDAWTLRVWGTLLRAGGHQTPHIHPLGWLSGVYYVELPDDMAADGAQAGWLEFGAPPARYTVAAAPEPRAIKPKAGRVVLFPSYIYHQTIPFSSDDPRISIAFDVMPTRLLKP